MTVTNDFFNRLPGVWANRIDGQWQDTFGWNLISQPQLGNAGTADFDIRIDQMRETITFKEIGIPRNIGIDGNPGFWHAMSCEIDIKTPEGRPIHHEMGHFLLRVLDDIDGQTQEELRGDIIRQASIPRANVMMTKGELRPESISEALAHRPQIIDVYSGKPKANDPGQQAAVDTALNPIQQNVFQRGGPDLTHTLDWLKDILPDRPEDASPDWVFSFVDNTTSSHMANGQRVENPVSVGNLLSDFWIGHREHNSNRIETFQYVQKVALGFHHMEWPHVAMNTLIKQP